MLKSLCSNIQKEAKQQLCSGTVITCHRTECTIWRVEKVKAKEHCVCTYKDLHLPDNVNDGNGKTNIPENFVAGFQRWS